MKRIVLLVAFSWLAASSVQALDPTKALSQYSRKVWTEEHGLPQDYINAITQTKDGYLWVGTDEGLARFDGYDFTIFNKDGINKDIGQLPSNSVNTLAAGLDGSLWIGTSKGVARYRDGRFTPYGLEKGLPEDLIAALYEDHAGVLWIVAGGSLWRLEGEKVTRVLAPGQMPFTVWTVGEDGGNGLWIAGFSGLAKREGQKFIPVLDATTLGGNLITDLVSDREGNLWMAGTLGVIRRSKNGSVRRYTEADGLPHVFVRSLCIDHHGVLWVGTNSGLARLTKDRFITLGGSDPQDRDTVWSLFEDREGNLWAGSVNGLSRFRDDIFTAYGEPEGLPGEDPTTIHEDRHGRVWLGFHNNGLMIFSPHGSRRFTAADGLPSNEIFSIRESRDGTLLVGTRGGLVRIHAGALEVYRPRDELGRWMVFDALEDSAGTMWLAMPSGLAKLVGGKTEMVIPGGPVNLNWVVSLAEGKDGSLWAATYGRGLWRIRDGVIDHFTTENGLSNNQLRALHPDPDGTLWIPTFGGGLNAVRDGVFARFTAKDGLLSDNIASVVDDGQSLWLGTTRGICRVPKQQLLDFASGKIQTLRPTNYGVADGLRSAQAAPSYPVSSGGTRTSDGRLWFPTSRGVAVFDSKARLETGPSPALHLVDGTVDGEVVNFLAEPKLRPGSDRIRFRYTAIHLSAPERVQYSHKLEGLDVNWVRAGSRREINYNSLDPGQYRFLVRAELPDGPMVESAFRFEMLPEFYETAWFRLLASILLVAAAWAAYQIRLRQLRYRFALMLTERARLAREIHDTLAQGFVGISSQLEALATVLPEAAGPARRYLDIARKMARHSITEARRSVMDLRASALEGHDLAAALHSGAQIWTAGSGATVDVDVSGEQRTIPGEFEQQLLRIAQEAVTNAVKHADAQRISVKLHMEPREVLLQVVDDGKGFEPTDVFSPVVGHFGLIGMRERAERMGGGLELSSRPGEGARVEVSVPLP